MGRRGTRGTSRGDRAGRPRGEVGGRGRAPGVQGGSTRQGTRVPRAGLATGREQIRRGGRAGQGGPDRRAEDLRRERDSSLRAARSWKVAGPGPRSAAGRARRRTPRFAAEEAGRLHRDRGRRAGPGAGAGPGSRGGRRASGSRRWRPGPRASRPRWTSSGSASRPTEAREGDRDDRAARLSEELAESRNREDRDAATDRLAGKPGRGAARRRGTRVPRGPRPRGRAGRSTSTRPGGGPNSTVRRWRPRSRGCAGRPSEAERDRDAERERAAGSPGHGGRTWRPRLAAVEPALATALQAPPRPRWPENRRGSNRASRSLDLRGLVEAEVAGPSSTGRPRKAEIEPRSPRARGAAGARPDGRRAGGAARGGRAGVENLRRLEAEVARLVRRAGPLAGRSWPPSSRQNASLLEQLGSLRAERRRPRAARTGRPAHPSENTRPRHRGRSAADGPRSHGARARSPGSALAYGRGTHRRPGRRARPRRPGVPASAGADPEAPAARRGVARSRSSCGA